MTVLVVSTPSLGGSAIGSIVEHVFAVCRELVLNGALLLLDLLALLRGIDGAKEDVHLLESLALCLGQEVGKDNHGHVDAGEEDEELPAERRHHPWRSLGQGKVKEPLGGRGKRNTVGPGAVVEDLCDNDPRHGAPSKRVGDTVDVEERGHALARRRRARGVDIGGVCLEERTEDVEEDAHACSRAKEGPTSAEAFDAEADADERGNKFDDTVDARGEKGGCCAVVADGLEDLGTKVAVCKCTVSFSVHGENRKDDCRDSLDRVLAGPLLEDKEAKGNEEADGGALLLEGLEEGEAALDFLLGRRLDLGKLEDDFIVVDGLAAEEGEVLERLLTLALACEPAGRLLDKDEADGHEARGNQLEAEGDTVDARVGLSNVLGDSVVCKVAQQHTQRDDDLAGSRNRKWS